IGRHVGEAPISRGRHLRRRRSVPDGVAGGSTLFAGNGRRKFPRAPQRSGPHVGGACPESRAGSDHPTLVVYLGKRTPCCRPLSTLRRRNIPCIRNRCFNAGKSDRYSFGPDGAKAAGGDETRPIQPRGCCALCPEHHACRKLLSREAISQTFRGRGEICRTSEPGTRRTCTAFPG